MDSLPVQIRRTVVFTGRVQGVGFRYTTCVVAQDFEVSGQVRNLDDGSVEVIVEATPPEIDRFISALRERMRRNVQDVRWRDDPAQGSFQGFGACYE